MAYRSRRGQGAGEVEGIPPGPESTNGELSAQAIAVPRPWAALSTPASWRNEPTRMG
ncbi:hypothetical protein R0J90_01775 [Micrococcus sp. SIMBA_144]